MTNPTEVPVVEAIRMESMLQLWPALLDWPHVNDVLWVNRAGSWWIPRPGVLNFARVVWWN